MKKIITDIDGDSWFPLEDTVIVEISDEEYDQLQNGDLPRWLWRFSRRNSDRESMGKKLSELLK